MELIRGGYCIPKGYKRVYDVKNNLMYHDLIAFNIIKPITKLVKINKDKKVK